MLAAQVRIRARQTPARLRLLDRTLYRLTLPSHPPAAFLNLEPAYGPAAGDDTAVQALLECRVSRVVVGLLHPLPRFRGQAVAKLRAAGITVDVSSDSSADAALCRAANEALLHRVAKRRPFSIWKYAMTLDGKIATRTGHAAWVSSAPPCAHLCVLRKRASAESLLKRRGFGGGCLLLRGVVPHLLPFSSPLAVASNHQSLRRAAASGQQHMRGLILRSPEPSPLSSPTPPQAPLPALRCTSCGPTQTP